MYNLSVGGGDTAARKLRFTRQFVEIRGKYGAYNCLMRDLRVHDYDKLRNYLRMEPSAVEELFKKVDSMIKSIYQVQVFLL
jgi:hypothetical protein